MFKLSHLLQRTVMNALKSLFLCLAIIGLISQKSHASADQNCGLTAKARILAKLIIEDPKQRRSELKCNQLLSKIADQKAREMAELGRVSHIGKNSANMRLVDAGYPLSRIYPRFLENNVKAIAGGLSEPAEMWQEFKDSEGHRMHLLAEHEFYLLQNEIGVGFYYDIKSPHVEYWVVYVAHQIEKTNYKGSIAKSKD